ncbi:MAG: 50S ribosomal protein L11 methyltransferase [Ruminococcaceae bacterium]|nr:50S ribosomal protein L11 methyltransferase [Oscillospiraceae bacterium]
MKWTQLRVTCNITELDTVCAVMSMIDNGLMIEDYSDIEENLMTVYGELIDEKILSSDRSIAAVSIYIPEEKSLSDAIAFLRDRFNSLALSVKTELVGVDEEDWANEWKKYYKTLHIGNRTVINPPWIPYTPAENEIVVQMDPGMAFGTGTHETTRLCLMLLERYLTPGDRVLDVGTGSGILSIAARKLGARSAYAYDIDPVAVRVAKDNVIANGVSDITCGVSDLLNDIDRSEPYDFVCANIVADILIRMSADIGSVMKTGGLIITSGIIEGKCEEVRAAMEANGFAVAHTETENDWVAYVFKKI